MQSLVGLWLAHWGQLHLRHRQEKIDWLINWLTITSGFKFVESSIASDITEEIWTSSARSWISISRSFVIITCLIWKKDHSLKLWGFTFSARKWSISGVSAFCQNWQKGFVKTMKKEETCLEVAPTWLVSCLLTIGLCCSCKDRNKPIANWVARFRSPSSIWVEKLPSKRRSVSTDASWVLIEGHGETCQFKGK